MAGHLRTVDTGTARRTSGKRTRKNREHLPPGQAAAHARRKQHHGARTQALDRINRTSDPLRQLDIAREYVRSAAAKYQADGHVVDAVQALLAAGDAIYTSAAPLSESARRTRRETAARHQQQRHRNQVLIREGEAAIRRQHTTGR